MLKRPTPSLSEEGNLQFFLAALENLEGEASALPRALVCHKITESKTSWPALLFLGVGRGGGVEPKSQLPAVILLGGMLGFDSSG